LGRLFGTRNVNGEKSEIVLSITPRIIRSQARPASENTEFWYGTESTLRSAPLLGSGGTTAGTVAVTTARSADAVANSAVDSGIGNGNAETNPGDTPKQRPELSLEGPGQVSVGQSFDVTLQFASDAELTNIRSMVRFDAAVFELTAAEPGAVLSADSRASAQPVVNQRAGRAQFDVPAGNISGRGSLLVLHFKALEARAASMIAVQQFAANGTDGTTVPTMAPRPLTVKIQ
jgi:general secretion pathway protein D